MAAAMEFVVTPLLLGLLGWLLDGRLGTQPLFTVGLALMGIIGVGISHYFRYMARVAREDEGKPWTRRPQ
jgi:F0F1-type ATP synthase assembly protein I